MDTLTEYWDSLTGILTAEWVKVGNTPISAGSLLKLIVFVILAFWVSRIARLGLGRLLRARGVQQSTIYAIDRLAHYVILVVGLVLGLSAVGFDFTSFALIAGALGLGIGLGIQPLVVNFFAGLILLVDRSLKVGDYVELESGVRGRVRKINMRYTIVTSNDNVDVLVPNSEFVAMRVVNWTHDEEVARIHIPFGVAYGTDKELVRRAALEAADSVPADMAYLSGKAPQVWFVGFGDSSLDFELLVWLGAENVRRPAAVRAAYLWEIHTALYKYEIEIPFPQRDLHVRSVFGMKDEAARDYLSPGSRI
ncbi:MAG: mechanosensitive ion channel [Pseudomonadales bacterium]|jgi:small-conductance mechanosensitive channel